MPFTKDQRLKGLKKQASNLGYKMVRLGSGEDLGPETEPEGEAGRSEDTDRGARTLARFQAQDEGW